LPKTSTQRHWFSKTRLGGCFMNVRSNGTLVFLWAKSMEARVEQFGGSSLCNGWG
jgi:hypothetical protein